MLKNALYINVFLLLALAIVILVNCIRKSFKKNQFIVAIACCAEIVVNGFIISNAIDSGWDLLILGPIMAGAVIICIVSVIISVVKKGAKSEKMPIAATIIMIVVPALLVLIPLVRDLYLINQCSYLIKYDYQNGIVNSEKTNVVIVNNKPYVVSLMMAPFDKDSVLEDYGTTPYYVKIDAEGNLELSVYNDKAVYGEEAMKIAEMVKESYSWVDEVEVYYLPEQNSAMVEYWDSHTASGQCFYHDGQLINMRMIDGGVGEILYYD